MAKPERLCIHCIYYYQEKKYAKPKCKHENSITYSKIDGSIIKYKTCDHMRSYSYTCGIEGRAFKPMKAFDQKNKYSHDDTSCWQKFKNWLSNLMEKEIGKST